MSDIDDRLKKVNEPSSLKIFLYVIFGSAAFMMILGVLLKIAGSVE